MKPKKLHTSVTVFGIGHSLMAVIFFGSGLYSIFRNNVSQISNLSFKNFTFAWFESATQQQTISQTHLSIFQYVLLVFLKKNYNVAIQINYTPFKMQIS